MDNISENLIDDDLYNLIAGRMKYIPSAKLNNIEVIPETLNTQGNIPIGIINRV